VLLDACIALPVMLAKFGKLAVFRGNPSPAEEPKLFGKEKPEPEPRGVITVCSALLKKPPNDVMKLAVFELFDTIT